jgi:WD40 repeat protein
MRIWDIRSGKDVKKIHAHANEVLSCDFNKYENFIATSSTDNTIKLWVINFILKKNDRI